MKFGDEWDDDERRRAAIVRRARTEGVEAAYEAALAICRDPQAPQQAKSNASRTLLQIGGLFERHEGLLTKEPHEMTAEELAAATAELQRASRARTRPTAERAKPPKSPGGIFD